MREVLAISSSAGDPTPYVPDEISRIAERQAGGVIEHLYLKADRSRAVIVLDTESGDEAERQLATLPLVQRGVTSFDVTELVRQRGRTSPALGGRAGISTMGASWMRLPRFRPRP